MINEHLELNPNEILVNERQPPRNVGRLVATTSFPYSAAFPTPIGKLAVEVRQGVLLRVTRLAEESALPPPVCSPQTDKIVSQITTYFSDPQQKFNFPVRLMGTVFQQAVWRLIQEIPVGETKTYSELALALSSGPRAVGNACRANPVLIVVPCHRVVAKQGLGGFSGDKEGEKIKMKEWLLHHEQSN